jgi:hypothetical protein
VRTEHLLALALGCAACSSAPLAPEARALVEARPEIAWRAAEPADLAGLFETERLEGEAAGALRKLWYCFEVDATPAEGCDASGSYSGAALVFDGERTRFQTLAGRWTLEGAALELGAGEALRVRAAEGRLEIEGATGLAFLRRVPLP